MPGAWEGALIGRVDNEAPFVVQAGTGVFVNIGCRLYLCINDDLNGQYGAGFSDNDGALNVTVKWSYFAE